MKIRDHGYEAGTGKTGEKNKITDVSGVKVGNVTIDTQENKASLTVIDSCDVNVF